MTAGQSRACADACVPIEHRDCHVDDCGCHCHRPKVAYERPARQVSLNPRRMLDLSEVGVGCWVEQGTSPDMNAVGRGGVVIGIDRVADHDTGEPIRLYSTVREGRTGIRFDRLAETDIDLIDVANLSIVRHLWRAMCREVGKKKRAVMTDELRFIETAHLLIRSVA